MGTFIGDWNEVQEAAEPGKNTGSALADEIALSLILPGYGLTSLYGWTHPNSPMTAKNTKKAYDEVMDVAGKVKGNVKEGVAKGVDAVKDLLGFSQGSLRDELLNLRGLGRGSGAGSGRGSGGGSGGGSTGGASGALSGYDSYLDMLHQEQERSWQREDTYYQRTVQDMQAAGLNPVLAVGHGVSGGASSASSDSQVVGSVADIAAMAISGMSQTAAGAMQLAQNTNPSLLQRFGSWYKNNAKIIQTGVNTAATLAKLFM